MVSHCQLKLFHKTEKYRNSTHILINHQVFLHKVDKNLDGQKLTNVKCCACRSTRAACHENLWHMESRVQAGDSFFFFVFFFSYGKSSTSRSHIFSSLSNFPAAAAVSIVFHFGLHDPHPHTLSLTLLKFTC